MVFSQLRDGFIQQLTQGYSHYDRQLRNDLLVLASLVASVTTESPFVETGFVKQLTLFATFQEGRLEVCNYKGSLLFILYCQNLHVRDVHIHTIQFAEINLSYSRTCMTSMRRYSGICVRVHYVDHSHFYGILRLLKVNCLI